MEFQEFEKLPEIITAEQWDGSIESAEKLCDLLAQKTGLGEVSKITIVSSTNGNYTYLDIPSLHERNIGHIRPNDWLVYFGATKQFEVWPNESFTMKFKKKENQDET